MGTHTYLPRGRLRKPVVAAVAVATGVTSWLVVSSHSAMATSVGVDVTASHDQGSPAGTVTSPSFTTSQPDEVLVAFVSADGPRRGGSQRIASVAGCGLTWARAARANGRPGTAEVWTAPAASRLTGCQVTATLARSPYASSITVVSFTGARLGATASASGRGAPSVTVTPGSSGSRVYAVGTDWDSATARTLPQGQSMVHQYLAPVGDTYWVQQADAATTAGTPVRLYDTAPTGDRFDLAAVELAPQATSEPSASPSPSATASATPSPSSTATPTPSPSTTTAAPASAPCGAAWSDPATWGGAVPAAGTTVTISKPICLDTDATVAGVVIDSGGSLTWSPSRSETLQSSGNVIVNDGGSLVMHPATAAQNHLLRFINVDESKFVGDGMTPVSTDVGLWVADGRLDLVGTAKTAWTRATSAVAAGATQVSVADATGWRVGDTVEITPTAPGATDASSYDQATVSAVSGNTVTLSSATRNAHPMVTVKSGQTMGPEVLDLTRNVGIEGTAGHRSHVHIDLTKPVPQKVDYAELRWMGPRQSTSDGYTQGVMGRYALHFHMNGDNSRGSEVIGTVVRDAGNHAFVPHSSNGITFRDDITHNTMDEPYWWDGGTPGSSGPASDDVVFDHDVASLASVDPPFRGYRLTGFSLNAGKGNVCRYSVAVGIQGNEDASGFEWPENDEGVWDFHDDVAHNNAQNGIFVWQNTGTLHVIKDFTAYYNGAYGIDHGAYGNLYDYDGLTLYGNGSGAVVLSAVSSSGPTLPGLPYGTQLTFQNSVFDGAGRSKYLVTTARHNAGSAPDNPGKDNYTLFLDDTFRGYTDTAIRPLYTGGDGDTDSDYISVVDSTFSGNEMYFPDGQFVPSVIRFQDPVHGTVQALPKGQSGTYKAAWNAAVSPVQPFYP